MPPGAIPAHDEHEKLSIIQFMKTWAPAVFFTTIYGSISIILGSITPGRRVSQWATRGWSRSLSKSLGISCEVIGENSIMAAPQCVFIANHCSLLDILIIGSCLHQDYRWLAKSALFKVPILGWHLRAAGHIRVYRGAEKDKNRDIHHRVGRAVREGASIFYFPEGTRNEDGRLQLFRRGAFVTAIHQKLPVVPIVLEGTGELMKKGTRTPAADRSKPCTLTMLPPIEIPRSTEDEETRVRQLTKIAERAFEEALNQIIDRGEVEQP